MARPLRIAAVTASAAVLLATQAAASPGSERTRIVPAATSLAPSVATGYTLEGMRRKTSVSAVAVEQAETASRNLERELPPIGATGPQSPAQTGEIGALRMRLVAQARTAAERVAAWSPPRRIVNLQDLREPLEAVATALNASDRYETALVAHLEEVGRARSELASLRARTVESLFELQRQVVDLQTQLTDAVRVEAGVPGSADPLVRNIQALVSRAQAAQLGLRRSEAEIAVIDEKLARQETAFRDGMRFAQQARTGLYRQMIQAENAISTMVPTLFDGAAYAGPIDTKGVLQVCPVDPPNAYSDDFGAPRYAGGYHPHQGNDIFAPEGTPIRAPFPGNAVVTSNTLGGNAVSVYGAQGYVYNAHLSQFGTLGPVEAGEIIGYVGNTGDAINSPSHDHFEWHPDNGSAVDPFVYLNAVCRPAAG